MVADGSATYPSSSMAKDRNGSPLEDAAELARKCRIETARAIHPSTKDFLLGLAAKYEAISGEIVNLDPDDLELQNAVADRLAVLAAQRREWMG
jgi:hypothetical protein